MREQLLKEVKNQFASVDEAAAFLNISRTNIYQLNKHGRRNIKLPFYSLFGKRIIYKPDLEYFIK